MAGSQLKQLKAALQANGLVGQTNIKRKNKKSKTPLETRRVNDENKNILAGIRSQFNQFDTKINRTKHDVTVIKGGKFVKVGSEQHNKASRTNSNAEKQMRVHYAASKGLKGRTGGIVDKRFGENNRNMTAEEKMLERFTRERQGGGKKQAFALGSDDENDNDDDDGFVLTHSGRALELEEEQGLGGSSNYVDEDLLMPEAAPARRKTKAEVMKEVIAKAKFHRHQRQTEFNKAQDDIMDLDEEFGDVMSEISAANKNIKPAFSSKTQEDIDYDNRVRELTYDRRSVPADRTKTEEEISQEHAEKKRLLEEARLKRMSGLDEDREAAGDDLDGFWNGSEDEDEAAGFTIKDDDEVEEDEEGDDDDEDDDDEEVEDEDIDGETALNGREKTPAFGRTLPRAATVAMPSTQEEFSSALSNIEAPKRVSYIKKIVETFQPKLAEGNKAKMDTFVAVLFDHILVVSNDASEQAFVEDMMRLLKKLAESFNQALVERTREELNAIHERVLSQLVQQQDLVFFMLVGFLFSTSDHYHLIVTPALIVMNEFLLQSVIYRPEFLLVEELGKGLFVADMLLNYQGFAKRYDPEVACFLEKALLVLVPEPANIDAGALLSTNQAIETQVTMKKSQKTAVYKEDVTLSLSEIFGAPTKDLRFRLFVRTVYLVEKAVGLWKDLLASLEVMNGYAGVLKHAVKYYAGSIPHSVVVLNKVSKMAANASRKPLRLQQHKAIAIATYAPKFEENFNPDKKSYDANRERQEVNKMKNQLKKEKKSITKDIRKQTRFAAREQIKEKTQMYADYHKKMANIVNSISTVEGAESNQYEREKKARKNRK